MRQYYAIMFCFYRAFRLCSKPVALGELSPRLLQLLKPVKPKR